MCEHEGVSYIKIYVNIQSMFLFFVFYFSINNSLLYMFLYLNDDTGPLQPVIYTISDSTLHHQNSTMVNNEYYISSILYCSVVRIV